MNFVLSTTWIYVLETENLLKNCLCIINENRQLANALSHAWASLNYLCYDPSYSH